MSGDTHTDASAALVRAVRAALAWEVGEPASGGTWPGDEGTVREPVGAHRVAPVLAPWRDRLGLDEADRDWLAAAQRANATWALASARRNIEIVGSLDAGGVRTLTLKGLPLALRTTANLAGRHCGDIDLLLRPADLAAADGVLRHLGFTPDAGPASSPLHDPYRRWVMAMDNHVEYSHPDGAHVELHWRLTRYDLLPLGFDDLWTARTDVDLGAGTVPALGELHDRLFVCVHAAKHDFQRLQWAVDVVRLLRQANDAQWNETVTAAHRLGVAVVLDACAGVARRLAADTGRCVAGLSDGERRRSARLVDAMWSRCLHGDVGNPGWIRQPLSLRRGARYRAWVLARNAVPPFLLEDVPGRWRPVRLIGRRLRRPTGHARPESARISR